MIVVRRAAAATAPSLGDVASDTWPSTGAIDTETASLAISIRQLGQDIFDANGFTTGDRGYFVVQNAWNAFVSDFSQWKDSAFFWNPSRRDELVAYRARFNALLTQWKAIPGIATAATPLEGAALAKSGLDKAADIAGSLVWILGIGAALWVGTTVYKEVKAR